VSDRGNADGCNTVVDMIHTPGEWVNSPDGGPAACDPAEALYMTIDLGAHYQITGATIWHYYGDDRAYCAQKLALSSTGEFAGEEYVAYDTGSDNGPTEAANGNAFTFPMYIARYARHWSAGNTQNPYVHFLEIDIYGLPDSVPAPPPPAAVWSYIGCYVDSGDRDLNGAGGFAVASVPAAAAGECATMCDGFSYFGLQWVNECFCDNDYGGQGERTGGECGDLQDDGTASLCANGQGNCGWANAVYATNAGLEAYYSFEDDTPSDSSSFARHGTWEGTEVYDVGAQDSGRAASFDGASRITVPAFRNFAWGDQFSLQLWFKRTGGTGNYQGIVNTGYYGNGAWEVRMGREGGGTMLGGGVVTVGHAQAWDHVSLTAGLNEWHSVSMIYNGAQLHFWLDGSPEDHAANDSGELVTVDNPLFIGQAGTGTSSEYFVGLVDEVKVWTVALADGVVASYNSGR
jgi:hypothetical protein